ncbi:MAG: hypothetical protein ACK40K_04650, partial [Raineya sp.]
KKMKKFGIFLAFVFISTFVSESWGQKIKPKVTINISGEIGKPSKDCAGFGLGCLDISISITLERSSDKNLPLLSFQVLDDNFVKIGFEQYGKGFDPTNEDSSMLEVEEDKVIKGRLATELGYPNKVITLKKGLYKTYEEKGIKYANVACFIR